MGMSVRADVKSRRNHMRRVAFMQVRHTRHYGFVDDVLRSLADAYGVATDYVDQSGTRRMVDEQTSAAQNSRHRLGK